MNNTTNLEKEVSFTQIKIKPKIWRQFFSLFSFSQNNEIMFNHGEKKKSRLTKATQQLELEEKEKQKDLFSEKMQHVLDSRMFDVFFNACEAGYTPSDKQNAIIHDVVRNLIANESYDEIEKFIHQGMHFDNNLVSTMLFYGPTQDFFNQDFFQGKKDLLDAPVLSEKIRQTVNTQEFKTFFTYRWLNHFHELANMAERSFAQIAEISLFKIIKPLAQYAEFFKMEDNDMNFDLYLKTMTVWRNIEKNKNFDIQHCMRNYTYPTDENKKSIADFDNNLKLLEEKLWSKKKMGLALEAKNLYMPEHLNHALLSQTKEYQKSLSIEQLPTEAKNILLKINAVAGSLLRQEQKDYEAERLSSHHVSQIIGKYLRIDTDYRDTLRNEQGQSPKDIMIETLSNILNKLEEKRLLSNETHLHDMNAIQRYSKKI